MARIVYGMNQSLDGYVDHDRFGPDETLFRHFVDEVGSQAGCLYGRTMYSLMRYWDDDDPGWSDDERAYATAWRALPKWVVSGTLADVGPNATLIRGDLSEVVRRLKEDVDGEIEVAGPVLASGLGRLGLIDEYRIYLHPVVLGHGTPFFNGFRPELRLTGHEQIGDRALKLTFEPTDGGA
ncbi:dihydrofolate reductase family protein [Tessaracoccus lacteus]|uniref:Dihydrofolate reductase family protein n=1 Tax=Tessaracoccus lacteus TaxID=3041766 RepID=A0ABY8PZJ5_9ACTN|nr:dihydrofolate reductase family protein [Tessaracoccus sp. T21]WGT47602.1 dihydrofolate reductase family protein [Tessaracoccus sp. T21]